MLYVFRRFFKKHFIYLIPLFIILNGCDNSDKIEIIVPENSCSTQRQVAAELQHYLSRMYPDQIFSVAESVTSDESILLTTITDLKNERFNTLKANFEGVTLPANSESFMVKGAEKDGKKTVLICGYDERGLMYAVYELLEKLGCRFYLSTEYIPQYDDKPDISGWEFANEPLVTKRIVFNWHNFLSGCSGWNFEQYKQWIDGAAKMKYNAIMLHAYGNNPMYNFSYKGVEKPNGYLANTNLGRDWGTQHVNDVRNLIGGEIFDDAVFGSEASKVPEAEVKKAAVGLMHDVFEYAHQKSIEVIFGFDIATSSSNPEKLLKELPGKARLLNHNNQILANPETKEGYNYFKSQVAGILKDYPNLNYLVPWVRVMSYPKRPQYFTIYNMPENWEQEYKEIVNQYSGMVEDDATRTFFYLGKMMKAYQKALNEIGRNDVKLGLGTWNWVAFPYFDKFIPEQVEFFPIDWDINFETEYAERTLSGISNQRKVYPIVWAHHDDHSYIGRPYTPPAEMVQKLKERKAEGFGILHWTTWPLDMYFKNLSQQVWLQTKNEAYKKTISDYAVNALHSSSDIFNNYLQKFYSEGPHFGRETSDAFYDMHHPEAGKKLLPVYNPDSVIYHTKERLALINNIKNKPLAITDTTIFKYYSNLEEFILLFFENQKSLIEAAAFLMNKDVSLARRKIAKTNPEDVIGKYVKTIQSGPMTTGEKAIILSLNLKWLPDFIDVKQKTGLIPIEYKFYPTFHEELAGMPGLYTYYAQKNISIQLCLGNIETGAIISKENNGVLRLSNEEINFKVGHWRQEPNFVYFANDWIDSRLLPGKYKLEFNVNEGSANNQKINIELRNDSGDLLNTSQQVHKVNEPVVFEIDHSLLHLSIKALNGTIELSGFSISKFYIL